MFYDRNMVVYRLALGVLGSLMALLAACAPVQQQPAPVPAAALLPAAAPVQTLLGSTDVVMRLQQSQEGQFDLRNNGTRLQTYEVRTTAGWLTAQPSRLVLAPGQSQSVRWTARCSQLGRQEGLIQGLQTGANPNNWLQVRLECQPIPTTSSMLAAVNQARQTGQYCGGRFYPPVGAVGWDNRLEQAALKHAEDLLRMNVGRTASNIALSHTGSDGSTVRERVTRTGYKWSLVGENIGWGYPGLSLEQAMKGWIDSASHCANLMTADFTQVGLVSLRSSQGEFWVQVFGKP